jgi:hypothetical protein
VCRQPSVPKQSSSSSSSSLATICLRRSFAPCSLSLSICLAFMEGLGGIRGELGGHDRHFPNRSWENIYHVPLIPQNSGLAHNRQVTHLPARVHLSVLVLRPTACYDGATIAELSVIRICCHRNAHEELHLCGTLAFPVIFERLDLPARHEL